MCELALKGIDIVNQVYTANKFLLKIIILVFRFEKYFEGSGLRLKILIQAVVDIDLSLISLIGTNRLK